MSADDFDSGLTDQEAATAMVTGHLPMTDLAAKIESALGEHTLYCPERISGWMCRGCDWRIPPSQTAYQQFDAHLARDVIAPLVEAHGREAAAADRFESEDEKYPPLTPEQTRLFTHAADAALRVRRSILLLAAHASGHMKHPHGDSCESCREQWPCVAVRRAAGPALDAVADLPSQNPDRAAQHRSKP